MNTMFIEEENFKKLYYKKWKNIAFDKSNFDFEVTLENIKALYIDLGFSTPKNFFYFESLEDAIKKQDTWLQYVDKTMPTVWQYQLPLTHPTSYWYLSGSKSNNLDLSIKRQANINGCMTKKDRDIVSQKQISKNLVKRIWDLVSQENACDYYDCIVYEMMDKFEKEFDEIEQKVLPKTCQATLDESIFLGPLSWMVKEISVVEFLIDKFNVEYHKAYVDYISAIVKYSGLIIGLSDTCIICNK